MNLQDLKQEIPYKWRVQSTQFKKAVCVAYIDSRDVQNLLDLVVGPFGWQSDFKEVKGNLYAGIAILAEDGSWVWKWDCGTESKTEAEKGEASDSFKRAAVKWGIGRFLYDLPIVRLDTSEKNGKFYPIDDRGQLLYDGDAISKHINNLIKNGKKSSSKAAPAPPAPAEMEELTPSHPKWEGAKAAIQAGTTTAMDIRKRYKLTTENESLLNQK